MSNNNSIQQEEINMNDVVDDVIDNSKDNSNSNNNDKNDNENNNVISNNTNQLTTTAATTITAITISRTTSTKTIPNITKSEILYDYNFLTGHPNNNELPINQMNQLFYQLSSSNASSSSSCIWNYECLQYGHSSGDIAVRKEIANFVSRQCVNDNMSISNIDDNNDNKQKNDNMIEGDDKNDDNATNYNILRNIDNIFCTTGISHGLDLILSCLCQPDDISNTIVYVEQPTYFLISQIFINHNCTIKYLPKKESKNEDKIEPYNTFDINLLRQQLEYYEANQLKHLIPKIIYIIPTYHNPTGYTMSLYNKYQLINVCIEYHIILIADEVYHLLDWSNASNMNTNTNMNTIHNMNNDDENHHHHHRKPARMAAIYERIKHMKKNKTKKLRSHNNNTTNNEDDSDIYKNINNDNNDDDNDVDDNDNNIMIISLWSLTKIWCPGIRFGWIECSNQKLHNQLCNYGYIASAGSCNPLTGEICKHLFQQYTIDQYIIHTLIPSYQKKCHMICQAIYEYNDKQQQLQQQNEYCLQLMIQPTGGYFIWLQLPNHMNANDFLHYCHQRNDSIVDTMSSSIENDDHHHTKTIHFMLGSRCDAIQMNATNTNKNQQQQKQLSSSLYDLSSFIRLCFVHMDIIELQNGIHIFLQKFHHYCSIYPKQAINESKINE